ncbi:hypothetical protein AAFF_G00280280 [Aldrovandia affinis]|uniref:Uncharacterized protein n=1 Tax=Aldrovandia affinis TaxID=143900 RepID=A0AAD7RCQ6_9TELE|nr:hypothetical protein AAFF_G00280280 [Aldrovandia affinis]
MGACPHLGRDPPPGARAFVCPSPQTGRDGTGGDGRERSRGGSSSSARAGVPVSHLLRRRLSQDQLAWNRKGA